MSRILLKKCGKPGIVRVTFLDVVQGFSLAVRCAGLKPRGTFTAYSRRLP